MDQSSSGAGIAGLYPRMGWPMSRQDAPWIPTADGAVTKSLLRADEHGENLLGPAAWQALDQGFRREGNTFVCDNGTSGSARRGLFQRVELNQREPLPFAASAWSKAEGVSGIDRLGLRGLPRPRLRRRHGALGPGGRLPHGHARLAARRGDRLPGEARQDGRVLPALPASTPARPRSVIPHCGSINAPAGAVVFDGVPVIPRGPAAEGFQVRDVAAGSDFVRIDKEALGLQPGGRTGSARPGRPSSMSRSATRPARTGR